MSWFKKKQKKTQAFNVQKITFICEQDGVSEQDLKQKFVCLFKERDYVKSAYLARVAYNDDVDQFNVALCIRSECEDNQDLRKAVGDIFADTFNTKEHLDIMFIEKKQEEELMRVCPVFYER